MNRLVLFYRSTILYILFIILSVLSVAGSITPIFSMEVSNQFVSLGNEFVRILDIIYAPQFSINGQIYSTGNLNFGYIVLGIFVFIFLLGSYFYLSRQRALAKRVYDFLLLFNVTQLIGLIIRYFQLQAHVSSYPDDGVEVYIGEYLYILAGVIVIGLMIRYFYIGIERRNSVYIYRKNS